MSTELFIKDKKNKRLREAWDERERTTPGVHFYHQALNLALSREHWAAGGGRDGRKL